MRMLFEIVGEDVVRSYCGHSFVLVRTESIPASVISDLQHDLRALGYHKGDVSGVWGAVLDAAVCAIRYDLTGHDTSGGVASYNAHGAVVVAPPTGASGVEPALANCIGAMSADPAFVKLPLSSNAVADNQRAWDAVRAMRDAAAPMPFLMAIFQQESGGRHFNVPSHTNYDSFVTVGLDHDDPAAPERVTSRGYGLGQYTLFHHPPTATERDTIILDPLTNARAAFGAVRGKFDHEVISTDPRLRADDRHAEWPLSALRICKYPATDARYLADCRACAAAAGKISIAPGRPVYPGASLKWAATHGYPSATYDDAPDRTGFGCDWPYAARRYNGGGINSYHYQLRVLINLLCLP